MRMARSTGVVSGAFIALLGLWGAFIPFVGPYFHYSFAPNTAWHYTTDRLWLNILPGLLATLAGIWLLAARTRVAGLLGGGLAIVAGAWFAIGPPVSLSWEQGLGPIGPPLGASSRQMLELVGYFYGLGALIVALGALAVGRFTARPTLSGEAAIGRAPRTEPLTPAPPAPAGSNVRRRRRLPLGGEGAADSEGATGVTVRQS
jgi:hypothetical protein